jgi:glycerol-3-phosphate cytidylyltransferase
MRVLTLGTWDLLHVGHLNLLQAASRYGHQIWVGVNTDRFVQEYKGRAPVIPEGERLRMVEAVKGVHAGCLNDGPGRDLIERLRPDCVAVGSDWMSGDYLGQIGVDQSWLERSKIGVLFLPRTAGVSSSVIRCRAA